MFKSKLKKRVEELESELKLEQARSNDLARRNTELKNNREDWITKYNKIEKELVEIEAIKRQQTEADMLLAAFKVILAVATSKPKEEVKQECSRMDALQQSYAAMQQLPYRAGGGSLLNSLVDGLL